MRRTIGALGDRDLNAVAETLDSEIEMPGAVGGLEEERSHEDVPLLLEELLPDDSVWA